MTTKDKPVSVLELKRLLHVLKSVGSGIGIRFRLMGNLWQTHYQTILRVTDNGVFVLDKKSGELTVIENLNHVMQFELEENFQQYEPLNHYTIELTHSEFK